MEGRPFLGVLDKMNRTKIINRLIRVNGYQTYLEIGVYKPKRNFDLIKCPLKVGVDPNGRATHKMTSDEFFKMNSLKWDIVFVDGLHTYEQAKRDVENSLRVLTDNGTIVMHYCNPPTEWHQRPEKGKGDWNGTVWKAFAELRMTREDLSMFVVDCDWGVGVIRRGQQILYPRTLLTYEVAMSDRVGLLNLITPAELKEWRSYDTCL